MVYAVEDGLEGLTGKQTKLASYWNTPFNKICLGMKVNGARETKWIVVDHQAWSLFNEIADGIFKSTTAGKVKWKSLIDNSFLQKKCNKEGFNFRFVHARKRSRYVKIRIGFVANAENNCDSPNSCIGFGTSVRCSDRHILSTTCGNMVVCRSFNTKNTPALGFILVQ